MNGDIEAQPRGKVIDVGPSKRRRKRWLWLLAALILLFVAASRASSIYLSALWFGSLGYSGVFWYIFKLKLALFIALLVLTTGLLRLAFWLIERAFAQF